MLGVAQEAVSFTILPFGPVEPPLLPTLLGAVEASEARSFKGVWKPSSLPGESFPILRCGSSATLEGVCTLPALASEEARTETCAASTAASTTLSMVAVVLGGARTKLFTVRRYSGALRCTSGELTGITAVPTGRAPFRDVGSTSGVVGDTGSLAKMPLTCEDKRARSANKQSKNNAKTQSQYTKIRQYYSMRKHQIIQ